MAREGGSYIKEKDGSLKLVHRTQPAAAKQKPIKAVEVTAKREVTTNEDS